jgi:hypothetical protein
LPIDIKKVKDNIEKTVKWLGYTKIALKVGINGFDLDVKSLAGVVLNLLDGPMQRLESEIISTYTKLRTEVTKPLIDLLNQFSKDPDTECLPIEKLGESIMNIIEGYDTKFKQAITDFFKLSKYTDSMQSTHYNGLSKKESLRKTYKVIDVIEQKLSQVLLNIDNFPVSAVDTWVVFIIESAGWDYSYDAVTDKITRGLSLDCGSGSSE